MKKILIWTLRVLAILLVAIQLIPVERTNPPPGTTIAAPAAVQAILKRSCFDCHSNETHWPWYAYVAPASWLVAHDVNDGREHLNFSNWGDISANKRSSKLIEMIEEIDSGAMPPSQYLILHGDAELSPEDIKTLTAWADS